MSMASLHSRQKCCGRLLPLS